MRDEKLLTLLEVSKFLRMSKSKLYQERKAGRLRTIRFGRSVRVRPRDVIAYVGRAPRS
jgi:excisionase family DNA binding protein